MPVDEFHSRAVLCTHMYLYGTLGMCAGQILKTNFLGKESAADAMTSWVYFPPCLAQKREKFHVMCLVQEGAVVLRSETGMTYLLPW